MTGTPTVLCAIDLDRERDDGASAEYRNPFMGEVAEATLRAADGEARRAPGAPAAARKRRDRGRAARPLLGPGGARQTFVSAAWAIVTGALEIVAAVRLRKATGAAC
jgi:hypothetical protein